MLFSREDVANFLNQNFEPAWETVRPVPIVRIDFGNGNVSTRTLHGNVASYVCTADGQIADILPGIYQPAVYTAALEQPRALAREIQRQSDGAARLTRLREYHRDRAQAIRNRPAQVAPVNPARVIPDRGKGIIERRAEQQVAQYQAVINVAAAAQRPRTASQLASWLPLAEDTRRNESERRLQIHQHLMGAGAIQPEQIKRWLYREVLHADLDDPTMGLGEDFFAPFER